MRILLFGRNGQVGWELNRALIPLGEIIALGREDADFSNPESLRNIVRENKPDVIVNAVAYTAVDKAEEDEALAYLINAKSPGVLAEEAIKIKALLVHYSTDYVFDGTKKSPYTEEDEAEPINAYGRTKLAGEAVIQSSGCDYLIFRTSWVYTSRGSNFLLTVLKLAKERDELNIVADQTGSPTSARLIAEVTALSLHQSIQEKLSGVFSSELFHLTSAHAASWYDFAKEIIESVNQKKNIELKIKYLKPIPTSEYPTPAKRPNNSLLSGRKLQEWLNVKMPHWKMVLSLCLEELIDRK